MSIVQWNQGEDRWLCTLLMQRGWRIEYVAVSDSFTNAPTGLKEFFNQRRRWVPSSLFNTWDVIKSWRETTRINQSISMFYILYQSVLTLSGLLAPMTVVFFVTGAIEILFVAICPEGDCWYAEKWFALTLSLIPPFIFVLICYYGEDSSKHRFIKIMTFVYVMIMIVTLIVLIAGLAEECGLCSISNQFFILLVSVYLIAAILHPSEIGCIIYGACYYVMMPTMFILLNIYAYMGLNNTSWGTREAGSEADSKLANESFSLFTLKCSNLFKCKFCYLPVSWFAKNEEIQKKKEEEEKRKTEQVYAINANRATVAFQEPLSTSKMAPAPKIQIDGLDQSKLGTNPTSRSKSERNSVQRQPSLGTLGSSPNIQSSFRKTITKLNSLPQIPINTQIINGYDLTDTGIEMCCEELEDTPANQQEYSYWKSLIKTHLYVDEKASVEKTKSVQEELIKLRDKFLILFFGMNILLFGVGEKNIIT